MDGPSEGKATDRRTGCSIRQKAISRRDPSQVMFAASMEALSYGASKLPFAIRHRLSIIALMVIARLI
jgi:hypothetical protein